MNDEGRKEKKRTRITMRRRVTLVSKKFNVQFPQHLPNLQISSRPRRNLGRSSSTSNSSKLWLVTSDVISNLLACFGTRSSRSAKIDAASDSAPKCCLCCCVASCGIGKGHDILDITCRRIFTMEKFLLVKMNDPEMIWIACTRKPMTITRWSP